MKRVSFVLLIIAIAILALVYAVHLAEHRAGSGVARLLPRNSVGFAHVPDFNATLEEWHQCDIYQIYREPAVQEFLHNPLSQPPAPDSIGAAFKDIQSLDAKDAFVGLTSITDDKPKLVAGFEFHCNQSTLDRVIGNWKSKINPSTKHEHVTYQKHDIELFSLATFSLAIVQDQEWIFASNDLEELKAVIDRADGRMKDAEALLTGDEAYRDMIKKIPSSYAFGGYFQPKPLIERLNAAAKSAGTTPNQLAALQQIRGISAATRFEHGKLHDVVFVSMPKQEQKTGAVKLNGLPLAPVTTIAFGATAIDFSKQIGVLFPTGTPNVLGPAAQRISEALAAAGIGTADWEAAFGSEFDLISDWSEQARWPSVTLTTAVKDPARGKKIIDALTQGAGLEERWEQSDRDGVHYWSLVAASNWLPIRPVMAMSDRMWITGLDITSVEATVERSRKSESRLDETDKYKQSAKQVPSPTTFFTYVDPGLIYTRLDATVRPFLMMGAAFLPAANSAVDLTKIPAPEVVTKHLSPIVASQYYSGDGYIGESIGPLTLNQAGIGVTVLGAMGAMAYHKFMPAGPSLFGGHSGSGSSAIPGIQRRRAPGSITAPAATATATPQPTP